MSKSRSERIRENFSFQGGRPQRRTIPEAPSESDAADGPGKRADEKIISIPVNEILPDQFQGRLRWPVELAAIERLYSGEWNAQDLLDFLARLRAEEPSPALEDSWQSVVDLARSILSEGQVAPITVYPSRHLPLGYRFIIETGEGRYWAYQMMRWLLEHEPEQLDVAPEQWREDPAYIRAVAITEPSRLRQVAENEQRQSYASAVDRAVAYASMLAEEAGYTVEGAPPGIRNGLLELPEAYSRAAKQGLRGRRAVLQQVPAGERQIQRHLKLLTDLDRYVLARAKQHGLTEAQLRPLVGKPVEEQRHLIERIVEEGLSSRAAARLSEAEEAAQPAESSTTEAARGEASVQKPEPTLPEEAARLLRSLTSAASRYERLRQQVSEEQLVRLLETELSAYDESARGAQRAQTPRRRLLRLRDFLTQLEL